MKAQIITVTPTTMKDNKGEEMVMYKNTLLTAKGICEVWTRDQYEAKQEVQLVIEIGRNYKPVVKIA